MLDLSPQQRRALRARAHRLHPVVSVGQHGMTPAVMHEVDRALAAHELVKVRVHNDDRNERERLLARICDELACAAVQHLGKLLILWRPAEPADAAGAAAKPKRVRKIHKGKAKPAARRKPFSHSDVAKRARGAERAIDRAHGEHDAGPQASRRRRGMRGAARHGGPFASAPRSGRAQDERTDDVTRRAAGAPRARKLVGNAQASQQRGSSPLPRASAQKKRGASSPSPAAESVARRRRRRIG